MLYKSWLWHAMAIAHYGKMLLFDTNTTTYSPHTPIWLRSAMPVESLYTRYSWSTLRRTNVESERIPTPQGGVSIGCKGCSLHRQFPIANGFQYEQSSHVGINMSRPVELNQSPRSVGSHIRWLMRIERMVHGLRTGSGQPRVGFCKLEGNMWGTLIYEFPVCAAVSCP